MASLINKRRLTAGTFLAIAVAAMAALAFRPAVVESVETAVVDRGDVVTTLEVEGSAESARNLVITCQVAGGSTILWLVPDGSQVTKGDELIRFDSSAIEDLLSEQAILVEQTKAAQIAAEHQLAAARLAVPEYVEGTFVELDEEADAAIATATHNLHLAEQMAAATRRLMRRGYVSSVQYQANLFAVEQAKLLLAIAERSKSVLETYNRPKMTQELSSQVDTLAALLRSATAEYELARKKLAYYHEQLDHCLVRAPCDGLVVYANDPGHSSSETPEIEQGAVVRQRQPVIFLPDLSAMQVTALVHESSVLRVESGQPAAVRVRGRDLPAVVTEVANQPARMRSSQRHLKYFMVSALIQDPSPSLRPGETVDLTLLLNYRPGVVRAPVETVVKAGGGAYVWLEGDEGIERRRIELGEVGDAKVEVRGGLTEGDRVVIKPRDVLPEVDDLFDSVRRRRRDRFGDARSISSAKRTSVAEYAAGG